MFGSSYDVDRNGVKYQNEQTKLMPNSPYAIAKLLPITLFIYRNAYGIHAVLVFFLITKDREGENFVTQKIINWIAEFKMVSVYFFR